MNLEVSLRLEERVESKFVPFAPLHSTLDKIIARLRCFVQHEKTA
jgi:hypothetical protein